MSLLNSLGVSEWTQRELDQKETAVAEGVSRRVTRLVQSAVADEFQIVDTDGETRLSELAHQIDAANLLLSLLNFPNKLKPFLDTILGLAESEAEFVATNLQVGQRSRSGRDACSDKSMEKWVSRQKQKLDEWMAYKSFHLVEITLGEYDFEANKRKPTRYKVNFNKYILKTADLAKTKFYWNKTKDSVNGRRRALREAARQVLQEIPKAPNLALRPAKTLSEEDKFNRRHNSVLTYLEKNRDALAKIDVDSNAYFMFLVGEIDKIATNAPGTVGKIFTPDGDEAVRQTSLWQKIKTGDINFDIENNSAHLDEKIELLDAVEWNRVDYAVEVKKLESVKQSASDNINSEIWTDSAKPLETNSESIGTFLKNHTDIFVPELPDKTESVKQNQPDKLVQAEPENSNFEAEIEPDLTDWAISAFNSFDTPPDSDPYEIIGQWNELIKEKIPNPTSVQKWSKDGVWSICWDIQTTAGQNSNKILNDRCDSIIDRIIDLSELKPAYLDWIMLRVERWASGVPTFITDDKSQEFRNRLDKFLRLPDG